jgi:hypothetical protein
MNRLAVRTAGWCAVAVWLAGGCREGHQVQWYQPPPGTEVAAIDSARAAERASLEPGALATVQALPVESWKGPGDRPFEIAMRTTAPEAGHTRLFGTITLPIALRNRSAGLSQYPCTSCHAGRKIVMENRRIQDAHHNIQPVHPHQTGATCSTCHLAEDVAQLALQGGGRAPLNESYRLCAQCHFRQAEAWAAGAHGKRLDGWEGRRVVMACPDCHDPHDPAVKSRVPFRAPQLEKTWGYGP